MRIWAKGIGANPSQRIRVMSALPPKADIGRAGRDVRFVPILLQKTVEGFLGQ